MRVNSSARGHANTLRQSLISAIRIYKHVLRAFCITSRINGRSQGCYSSRLAGHHSVISFDMLLDCLAVSQVDKEGDEAFEVWIIVLILDGLCYLIHHIE